MATNNEPKWYTQLDKDLDEIERMIDSLENDTIYDESGIVIGEARPIVEPTDIELTMPDILDDDVLPESGLYPEHDEHNYVVFEAENVYDRTDFILNYLAARDDNAARLRDSW